MSQIKFFIISFHGAKKKVLFIFSCLFIFSSFLIRLCSILIVVGDKLMEVWAKKMNGGDCVWCANSIQSLALQMTHGTLLACSLVARGRKCHGND